MQRVIIVKETFSDKIIRFSVYLAIMAQPVAPPAFMWQFHHAQMAIPALIGRVSNPGPGAHTADILGLPGGSFICDLALIYGIYSPCIGQRRALIRMQLLNYNHNNNLKIIYIINHY
jgi:hypothetical protein